MANDDLAMRRKRGMKPKKMPMMPAMSMEKGGGTMMPMGKPNPVYKRKGRKRGKSY